MEAQGRKEVVEAAVQALLVSAATKLAEWAIDAIRNRNQVPKDADGFVTIE